MIEKDNVKLFLKEIRSLLDTYNFRLIGNIELETKDYKLVGIFEDNLDSVDVYSPEGIKYSSEKN